MEAEGKEGWVLLSTWKMHCFSLRAWLQGMGLSLLSLLTQRRADFV